MIAAKRLIQKAVNHHHHPQLQRGNLAASELDLRIVMHYGIPSTASLLAFDPIQRLLAIATLDGRIKVIGGDGIEGFFVSPNQSPYKYIEFLQNRGFLASISNENHIAVWDLERRCLACSIQWESNITAFSVISGSYLMYIGDEHGLMSVVKFDVEESKLLQLPYQISPNHLNEAAELPSLDNQPIVGILPQPCFSGNRVLIAYQNGVTILWDVFEAQILFVGGGKDLELKDEYVDSQNGVDSIPQNNIATNQILEKEISALCWASSTGSILAVGYVDGDIMFWKTSNLSSIKVQQNEYSSNNVVKLQLSSAARRLPVIVLHWSASHKSSKDCDGQLYIYGGDEVGSAEVLTILSLEWSPKTEILSCTSRTDLTLNGSFADMILLPDVRSLGGSHKVALSVLTNPGQLHLYDDARLSAILSEKERDTSISAVKFSAVVPIADPPLTSAKLASMLMDRNLSRALSKANSKEWPLTGGVPAHLSSTEHISVELVFIAGYQDGSVRFWNTLYGVLSLICVLEGKVEGADVAGCSGPVSAIEFCSVTLNLAIGNECGLVRVYNLDLSLEDTSFHIVTDSKHEVLSIPPRKGPHFRAAFSLLTSPIHALQFANCGTKLAVGFDCGRVAILDLVSLAVLFFTESLSSPISPVVSINWRKCENSNNIVRSLKNSETNILANNSELVFILTKDGHLNIIDGSTGSTIGSHPRNQKKKSIAISMYVIEDDTLAPHSINQKQMEDSSHNAAINENQPMDKAILTENSSKSCGHSSSSDTEFNKQRSADPLLLICCEDSLRLYSTKHVIQGNKKSISKVKLVNPCCWTSTLKKDDNVCGLVLLFRTGIIEIRSYPHFEVLKESSIMSTLRWNYQGNMEKMMSSDNGQITLANGSELAFISLLVGEEHVRVPESFPSLHDKVLAAAADAAISFSSDQKKKQGTKLGILAGITKGFKSGKTEQTVGSSPTTQSDLSRLESIFSKAPISEMPPTATNHQETVELNIDDIEIDDEPPIPISASPKEVKHVKKVKNSERERLLGKADDIKPRMRTPEEIRAQYRKAEDASSVAADARNKLLERQEKLERINRRTAELQSGAENFASLADELVKVMENRKWWQI